MLSQRAERAKLLSADEADEKEEETSEKAQESSASQAALKLSGKEEKQMKAVLDKGAAKKAANEDEHVLAKSDDVADDYQATVQAAMDADLRRRSAERKAREAFRSARAKRLAADNYAGKLEAASRNT